MAEGRQYVMGRVVVPPSGATPPVIETFRGRDPRVERLVEAARLFRKNRTRETLQQLADAAEDIE